MATGTGWQLQRFGDGYGQQAWLRLLVAAAPLLVIATRMCAPGAARPCSVCDKVCSADEHTGGERGRVVCVSVAVSSAVLDCRVSRHSCLPSSTNIDLYTIQLVHIYVTYN